MQQEALIKTWIMEDEYRAKALKYALALDLNDWCLAAGFVRNLVWDKTHNIEQPKPLNDIDLIYFNPNDYDENTDRKHEEYLKSISDYPWSVKNQARMNKRNLDAPYSSSSDAMSYWVEVETAVGVRLTKNNDIELVAPFGLDALFNNTITINDKRRKPESFKSRVTKKKWLEYYPNLKVKV